MYNYDIWIFKFNVNVFFFNRWIGFMLYFILNVNLCYLVNYNLVLISVIKKNQRDNFFIIWIVLYDYEMVVIFVKKIIFYYIIFFVKIKQFFGIYLDGIIL